MDPRRDPRRGPRPALSEAPPPPAAPSAPARRSWRARIRAWLRPPRLLRPTRAGWCFFVVVFGVGFAALNTGNNLLYLVLSLMLAFLALSGVLSEAALRGIEVRRHLPRELFADTANAIGLEIANTQRRVAAFAIVVEDRIVVRRARRDWEDDETRSAGRAFVLRIDAGKVERRRYALQPERRGPLAFAGFQVSTRFPFGLFMKSRWLPAPSDALVYPAVERVAAPSPRTARSDEGDATATARGAGAAVSGVREYAPGDAHRRIHWPLSLRRGELLVREIEDERNAEVEVLLRTAGCEPGEPFEARVRWAASEVVAQLEAGRRVALRTDADRLPADAGSRQRARLLSFLARVAPGTPRTEPDGSVEPDAQPRRAASR